MPSDYGVPSATKKTLIRTTALPGLASPRASLNALSAASKLAGSTLNQDFAQPFQALRARMVQNLMSQGVKDVRVLAAMGLIERHHFVDSALANQGYEDTSLPIGLGQTISKPNVVARMLELLVQNVSGKLGRVLEIGTGCGYQAALLGQLATEVYSMERLRGLNDRARENLRAFRLPNVHLIFGDGMLAYPKGAPYAAIIAAAGGAALPTAWTDQLAIGGRLVAPMETSHGVQALVVVDKTANGLQHSVLEAVKFVPLKSGTN
jgi:protein-L-isoaspartate(D-aspartate) O-methyltransferase